MINRRYSVVSCIFGLVYVSAVAAQFPANMPLPDLDGTDGISLDTAVTLTRAGSSISALGDINGDGINDIGIGAAESNDNAGHYYVVFGSDAPGGLPANLDLDALDGTDGFRLNASLGDFAGEGITGGCDLNADGRPDVVVEASLADTPLLTDAGAVYIVFGREDTNPFPASIDLGSLLAADGTVITGDSDDSVLGLSVACLDDVNGDGSDDLLIGKRARGVDPGRAWLIFGGNSLPASLDVGDLDGSNGIVLLGENTASSAFGIDVAAAGDVNGDLIEDFMVVGIRDEPFGLNVRGVTYVVYGRPDPANFPNPYDLTALDGDDGFRLFGDPIRATEDEIAGAGDINGDGFADVLVADSGVSSTTGLQSAGRTWVVYGGASLPPTQVLNDLDGTTGFIVNGATSFSSAGVGVGGVGDVNSDGVDDFGIAAAGFEIGGGTGRTYIVYGDDAPNAFPGVFSLAAIDGSNGFTLDNASPFDDLANQVTAAGDVNGDGLDDILTGARFKRQPPATPTGGAYLVYGLPAPTADLKLSLVSCGNPVPAGGDFDYGVKLSNGGPDLAKAAQVIFELDEDLSLVESVPGGLCVQGMDDVECELGDLNAGQSAQFAINVQADISAVSPVVSSALASSSTLDVSTGNNVATSTDGIVSDVIFGWGGERCRPVPE